MRTEVDMFSNKCVELMREVNKLMTEEAEYAAEPISFTSSTTVRDYAMTRLHGREREHFDLLLLDSAHNFITCINLFKGTINAAAVYPRVVVQEVLHHNASAVILMHNHPSGVSRPSQADLQLTKKLQQALQLIDVNILDHIIIGDIAYAFSEHGDLQ